ncbi:MAG TPA: hypothetical protein VK846_14290 [Candidatus Limnocylindria bacterium]|nr:hypothetical protein [Candidatus Limnocylindria bacterium]
MKIVDIRARRNRAPFRPFQIRLTNGGVLSVGHPEQMSLPDDEREMFVVWTDTWNLIDITQVARVSVRQKHPRH